MKPTLLALLFTIAFSVTSPAKAKHQWTINVPFEFESQGQKLPAGIVTVEDYGRVLRIQSSNAQVMLLVPVEQPRSWQHGQRVDPLIFRSNGPRQILTGVGDAQTGQFRSVMRRM